MNTSIYMRHYCRFPRLWRHPAALLSLGFIAFSSCTVSKVIVEPVDATSAADTANADIVNDAGANVDAAKDVEVADLPAVPTEGAAPSLPAPLGWTFTEIGAAAGVTWKHQPVVEVAGYTSMYDHGSGMATGDFDGDGHEDLLLLNQCGSPGYYLGHGDGTFTNASSRLQVLSSGIRVGVTYGDYDGDGDTDFYVTFTRSHNMLLQQQPDGSFVNVAQAAGVDAVGHLSGAAFVDVDRDGWLDIVVAGNRRFTLESIASQVQGCPSHYTGKSVTQLVSDPTSDPPRLFRNLGPQGGFAFAEESQARGLPGGGEAAPKRSASDITVVDFDRDGAPDLMMSDMFGQSSLLHNDGTGHFTDVIAQRLPQFSYGTVASTWTDYNGDGWPDVLATDMHSDMWIDPSTPFSDVLPGIRYKGLGGPASGEGDNPTGPLYGNSMWLQGKAPAFAEVSMAWHTETFQPWGHQPADFDNDGDPDVYVAAGMSNPYLYTPSLFLLNDGAQFTQMQTQLGLDPPADGAVDATQKVQGQPYIASARTAAVMDWDEDGDLDLVVLTWNHRVHLLRNDLPAGRHWLDVAVDGKAPRDPYGAWIDVFAGGYAWSRSVDGQRGYLSQSSHRVHFGLGNVAAVSRVLVHWPDGTSSEVLNPAVDSRITVVHP